MDNESIDMDPELAKRLLIEGATLIILNFPLGIEFGIDMKSWHTDKKFMGIKMIPPGIHIVYYNGNNKYGDVAPRISFFHNFKRGEFLVKKWDNDLEEVNSKDVTDADICRLKSNLLNLDQNLGVYPFDVWNTWRSLSNKLSEPLLNRASPKCGVIHSALELVSTDFKSNGEAKKRKTDSEEGTTSQVTNKVRFAEVRKMMNRKSIEDSLLPELKPVDGTELRFSEIPDVCYPEGSTPADITRHSIDLSYTLNSVISGMNSDDEVIGELQMSFICFLIGLSLESLEVWRRLVWLVCRSESAMSANRSLYAGIIGTLEAQLEHIPEDFLVDIVLSENVIYTSLRELFRAMLTSKSIESRLKSCALKLQQKLTERFGWDFDNLDEDDEDDAPVIVELEGV